jgi:endonuclease/exonuclease/phosphatase family metal-dependent hydrolase
VSRLRLVTLNTWKNEGGYAARLSAMAAQLAALDADVVALQECFACPGTGDDTAARLASATGLHLTRAPARAKARLHGGAMVESRSDLALLTRQAPLMTRIIPLPMDARDGERPAILADVPVGQGSPALRVAATHLTHLRDAAARAVRTAQATALMAEARNDHAGGFAIMGDLNDTAQAQALAPLFADPGLDQACIPAPVAAPDRLRLGAIDHILLYDAARDWRIECRTLCLTGPCSDGAAPSDHPGVLLDLVAL